MKRLLRLYLFTLFALWLTTYVMSGGVVINAQLGRYLFAAGLLALLNLLLKPVLKLVFFPLNIATLGLFTFVINALIFYLFVQLIPEVSIHAWTFPGFSYNGMVVPKTEFPFWLTIFAASLLVTIITNLLSYLAD